MVASSSVTRTLSPLIASGSRIERQIVDWAFDLEQIVSNNGGSANGFSVGKANFGDVTLSKYVDRYSPTLFTYLAAGTPLTVMLAWVTTSQTTGNAVLRTVYHLNTVLLTSQSHAMDDERPLEKLRFAYGQLAIGHQYSNANGGGQAVSTGSWSVIRNARCSPPDCPSWIS